VNEVNAMNRTHFVIKSTILAVFILATAPSTAWAQCQVKALAPDPTSAASFFGLSVSVDGGFAACGDPSFAANEGRVFVYKKVENLWQRDAEIPLPTQVSPIPDAMPRFGWSVAISGNRLVVGAPADISTAGRVFFFVRDSATGNWTLEHATVGLNPDIGDQFGHSVALRGDTAVVGAPGDEISFGSAPHDQGAVHVFDRDPVTSQWTETKKIGELTTLPGDRFGASVALSEWYLVVGANQFSAAGAYKGRAFVYAGPTWDLHTILAADDAQDLDFFGSSVSVDDNDDVVAVGAPNRSVGDGAVYLFRVFPGTYSQLKRIDGPSNKVAKFGASVGLEKIGDFGSSERRLVIGAPSLQISSGVQGPGVAYVYDGQGYSTWQVAKQLLPHAPVNGQGFGTAVSHSDDHIFVGAPGESQAPLSYQGSAYLFSGKDLPLCGIPDTLSTSAGGTQSLTLDAGSQHAGKIYLLLGSLSGTVPGTVVDGVNVPLNYDALTQFTLSNPNTPPYFNSLGVLDASGKANASIQIPGGAFSSGVVANHAFIVLNGPVVFASNAVPLVFGP
jgi:FG-GAP repeat